MLRIDGRIDPPNAIDHTSPSIQWSIRTGNDKIHRNPGRTRPQQKIENNGENLPGNGGKSDGAPNSQMDLLPFHC